MEKVGAVCPTQLALRERHVFAIEKYVEDVKQDEKHVLDLLESIMRPTCLAKEELRPILFKMTQLGSNILKIKVSTFWIPEIRCFPAGAFASLLSSKFEAIPAFFL